MTAFRFAVGELTITAVSDGISAFPAPMVFGNAPADERDRALQESGLPAGDVRSSLTSLVIDSGRRRVLVDTGIGPYTPDTGKLLIQLRESGFEPESIDTVILTHGHPDHIGGTVDAEGRVAFPNAEYVMHAGEWAFWTDEAVLDKAERGELHGLGDMDRFMGEWARTYLPPIRDRLRLVDGRDGEEIVPGIFALPAPGHTPHHMGLVLASGDQRLFSPTDVAINPLHPRWHPAFDYDPQQALETKRRLYDRLADDHERVFVYHFPFPGLGYVEHFGDGWRWTPER